MARGLFVTGTDTGVGKTVVAAALLHRYRGGRLLRYWKPIQTGIECDDDTAEVARIAGCDEREIFADGVRLPRRVSPHVAARLSGCTIDVISLLEAFRREDREARWIIEGAGGVLVPINDSETMADLMTQLGLPVVVVARTALGTINQTLLTIEALRRRAIEVLGVVMVGLRILMRATPSNGAEAWSSLARCLRSSLSPVRRSRRGRHSSTPQRGSSSACRDRRNQSS